MSTSVSIIIPVLNESVSLATTLDAIADLRPVATEVLVVDGGSTDDTLQIADKYNCKVLYSNKKGRAAQMDLGARKATGDYLIFLHADTIVQTDLIESVNKVLSNPRNALGGFVAIMKGKRTRGWFTFLNYIKTYLCPFFYRPVAFFRQRLKLLFGDQVMFCRKEDYLSVGGFDTEMTVMEEADLCLKMSRIGRVKMVHRFVFSSDRRVTEWGFWKANRIYWYIAFGWVFGVKNHKMGDLYTEIR